MISLAGLSNVYPGELAAEGQSQQNDLRKVQLDQAQAEIAGKQALGRVFQQMVPGAQPNMPPQTQQMAPQAPPPGQPSQPMQPPQGPPQQPPGPAAGGARAPQPGLPPGAPPAGAQAPQGGLPSGGGPQGLEGRFDLKTAAAAIAKANPGIQPRILVEALTAALPYLNAEAKQAVAEMRVQMQQENLNLRQQSIEQRENQFQTRESRLRDENEARQKRFDTREGRLEAKQAIQNDQAVQRLALQQKGLEYRIAAGDRAASVKEVIAIAGDKRRAAVAAALVYADHNGMDDAQKAALVKGINDAAKEEIAALTKLQGSSTPTGGTPQTGGGKTSAKAGDQPKPIPSDIRGPFDTLVKEHPEQREAAIKALKDAGYMTDGL